MRRLRPVFYAVKKQILWEYSSGGGPDTPERVRSTDSAVVGRVWPDDRGGLLADWMQSAAPEYSGARTTIEEAFQGYAVMVSEGTIEDDKRHADKYHRQIDIDGDAPGSNGETTPLLLTSQVHMGTLFSSFKSAFDCGVGKDCTGTAFSEMPQKTGFPRGQLVTALGRGTGATGAHEIGHQHNPFLNPPVLSFTVHNTTCLNCYDYTLPAHIPGVPDRYPRDYCFGPLKWSDKSLIALEDAKWPRK